MRRTTRFLVKTEITFENFEQISRISFSYKMEELITKVMSFIDNNFNDFIKKEGKELNRLNDLTDGRLIQLMADNYSKLFKDYNFRGSGTLSPTDSGSDSAVHWTRIKP